MMSVRTYLAAGLLCLASVSILAQSASILASTAEKGLNEALRSGRLLPTPDGKALKLNQSVRLPEGSVSSESRVVDVQIGTLEKRPVYAPFMFSAAQSTDVEALIMQLNQKVHVKDSFIERCVGERVCVARDSKDNCIKYACAVSTPKNTTNATGK
jgi:hypothetical protein